MIRINACILAVHALAALATAQDPDSAVAHDISAAAGWRIPIHTAPDDPIGGAYGVWACGPDYKVSFHEGFAFYPLLGRSYPHNLPLRLGDANITFGGSPVSRPDARIEVAHGDWRYEYRRPDWTEIYEVVSG